MKTASLSFVLWLFVLGSLLSCNANSGTARNSAGAKLLAGEYLSTTYIDQLKKTRSPLKAGTSDSSRIDLVQVQKDGNVLELAPIYNFHEGGALFTLASDGSIVPPPKRESRIANLSAAIVDEQTFRLGFDEGEQSFKPATYVFVRDAAEYVAKAILVGKYKDSRGRDYEFREDGWAVFPKRKFRFEIGIDHVLTPYDYFMEMGDKGIATATWAFRWKGETLQIFRTNERDDGIDEIVGTRPQLSLRIARLPK